MVSIQGINIFKTLLDKKVEYFVSSFNSAKELYFDERGNIHPGEYGIYREKCLKQLLRSCLTKEYEIGDGFVFNSLGKISTQADIIIYNSSIDAITVDDIANYYAVEMVYGIGEVKSELTLAKLKTALRKLSKQKMIASEKVARVSDPNSLFISSKLPVSFLVCKKIKKVEDITNDYWTDVYAGLDSEYRHNIILSIDDGCFLYAIKSHKTGKQVLTPNTEFETVSLIPYLTKNDNNTREHIYLFLSTLRDYIEHVEKIQFPFGKYLDIEDDNCIDCLDDAFEENKEMILENYRKSTS